VIRPRLPLIVCLAVAGCCCAQSSPHGDVLPFTVKPIAARVWAAVPNPNAKDLIQTNVGVIAGDDGVLVVDTLASVDASGTFSARPSEQLLAAVRDLTKLPVKYVVNTHYHLDHVGGNRIFADAGVVLVGHENVRRWIRSENLRPFGPKITPAQQQFIDRLAAPTVTITESTELDLGRRTIPVRGYQGHSGSDSAVIVPDAKVVFAGDLLWPSILPTLVDASTDVWIDTLEALATSNPDAAFVPGHGEIARADDVRAFREYLVTLRQVVADAQRSGKSGEELVSAAMQPLREKYGRWNLFDAGARENILEVDSELRGTKRVPQP
jgi:cyclase